MKVELIPTITNQKTNFFTKVKRYFVGKLKLLMKDTFEKSSTTPKREKIVSRKYPNWCEGADSTYRNNTIAKTRCYYPEDIEKMKSMTDDEIWDYKDHLDDIGRFYYDDNYHIDTPALDKLIEEYGIDMNKFIIKDK